jgi:hemoglobin-like flavoprotein
MNSDQCCRVRLSIEVLRGIERPFALLFFGKFFELDPSVRALFKSDLRTQGDRFMDFLNTILAHLEDPESIRTLLEELGQRHTVYGVKLEQYRTVETALIWALSQALGADFDGPTRAAWKVAIESASAVMQSGGALPPPSGPE